MPSSALELTPEKFHDFLSLASSPALLDTGSPDPALKPKPAVGPKEEAVESESVGTPPAPSFAQVCVY